MCHSLYGGYYPAYALFSPAYALLVQSFMTAESSPFWFTLYLQVPIHGGLIQPSYRLTTDQLTPHYGWIRAPMERLRYCEDWATFGFFMMTHRSFAQLLSIYCRLSMRVLYP